MTTTDASTDDGYAVYWEVGGGKNHLSVHELRQLHCDPASWAAFLFMLAGQRRYAAMTSHTPAPDSRQLKMKVIPFGKVAANATYETIK
jgi:hypothetical protein